MDITCLIQFIWALALLAFPCDAQIMLMVGYAMAYPRRITSVCFPFVIEFVQECLDHPCRPPGIFPNFIFIGMVNT